MKLPWAPRGLMFLFLIEEALPLPLRVLFLLSGQSAIADLQSSICNGKSPLRHQPHYKNNVL